MLNLTREEIVSRGHKLASQENPPDLAKSRRILLPFYCGTSTICETERREDAENIQKLWTLFEIDTDIILSKDEWFVIRPTNLNDDKRIRDILEDEYLCHVCWKGSLYSVGRFTGTKCSYCDNR